jgi:hypothetical protein
MWLARSFLGCLASHFLRSLLYVLRIEMSMGIGYILYVFYGRLTQEMGK